MNDPTRLASEFDREASSNIVVRFTLHSLLAKPDGISRDDGSEPDAKRARTTEADGTQQQQTAFVGAPVYADKLLLTVGSARFSAQIERWLSSRAAGPSSLNAADKVELRVPLGSESEVPAARAAIQFIYTGNVNHCSRSFKELLQVRRQAGYLQITGCTKACDNALIGLLSKEAGGGNRERPTPSASDPSSTTSAAAVAAAAAQGAAASEPSAAQGVTWASGEAGTSSSARLPCPGLAFYACSALFPDAAEDAGFGHVLDAGSKALVAHFGDALAVLNKKPAFDEWCTLPPVALEALLAADDFGTDEESSVLLLLAYWREAQGESEDASEVESEDRSQEKSPQQQSQGKASLAQKAPVPKTSKISEDSEDPDESGESGDGSQKAASAQRSQVEAKKAPVSEEIMRRLCRLVRLLHVGSAYLSFILPDLDWFPISGSELAFITHLASCAGELRSQKLLRNAAGRYDTSASWYGATRRQCLGPEGRAYTWQVTEEDLKDSIQEAAPDASELVVTGYFEEAAAFRVEANGFGWVVQIVQSAPSHARVYFLNEVPEPLGIADARGIATVTAHIVVHGWRSGARRAARELSFVGGVDLVSLNRGFRDEAALPLRSPQPGGAGPAGAQAPTAPAAGAAAAAEGSLAPWARYLHQGKMTGTLTFGLPGKGTQGR